MDTTTKGKGGGPPTIAKTTSPPLTLERDPEDGEPRPKKWLVEFTVVRNVEVEANSAKEAEETAREEVLFADEFPLDREEITNTHVGWINLEPAADQQVIHMEGCWGNHCRHYDCDTSDCAIDYREYCSQCDIDNY